MKRVVADFDPAEFSERYEFKKGKVWSKSHRKFLNPSQSTNQHGRVYHYYPLRDNAGILRKISAALIRGRVEKVGDLFQIKHWPKGWEARPGFPAYLFHPGKRIVRRVGFKTPRTEPVDIKPNKVGKYRLLTPDGYRWYHTDDLFV